MSDTAMLTDEDAGLHDWHLRPWILAGIGLLSGLAIHLILESEGESGLGAAAVSFLFFGSASAAFVLRPIRLIEAAMFSLVLGIVMAGIAWLAFNATGGRSDGEFTFAAGVFFSLLAIPLFQADFHRKRWNTSYEETHFHCWTDAVSAGGAFAFVGLSWLLLWLLHGLFSIVGIEVIERIIETDGFGGAFVGATFGGAMGVLRNQLNIIGTLQRVVMLVFALLAAPFAVAIVIFLFILITSGGNALWEATDSATPILLSCAVAAFILTNSIVRDNDEMRSANAVMLASAMALAACILPLAIFASIGIGIRIDQYGLAPERIWALIAVIIAAVYGVAYWAGLISGRKAGWCAHLRIANLRLAVVSCVIALILALPILNFGAISASNQLARLEAGKVSVEDFDYTALRWDFGDAGREALAQLVENDNSEIAKFASAAQAQESRPYRWIDANKSIENAKNAEVVVSDQAVEDAVREELRQPGYLCAEDCRVVEIGQHEVGPLLVFESGTENLVHTFWVYEWETAKLERYWVRNGELVRLGSAAVDQDAEQTSGEERGVELRPFVGRQLYVDGKPVGDPFK